MKQNLFTISVLFLFIIITACSKSDLKEEKSPTYSVFSFQKELTLPGKPEIIYDTVTGDISGWWDHSFSEKPAKFYIEPKPGGGFYEIFNESGDGVLHATVIFAQRGKLLRFTGPLGLSGKAINLVCSYTFESVKDDSTKLILDVHASGEIEEGTDKIVEKVWEHFLFERLKPFVDSGKHLE